MKTDDLIELLVKDLAPWRFRSILANSDRFLFKFVAADDNLQ